VDNYKAFKSSFSLHTVATVARAFNHHSHLIYRFLGIPMATLSDPPHLWGDVRLHSVDKRSGGAGGTHIEWLNDLESFVARRTPPPTSNRDESGVNATAARALQSLPQRETQTTQAATLLEWELRQLDGSASALNQVKGTLPLLSFSFNII
jgi:hypothetical protein